LFKNDLAFFEHSASIAAAQAADDGNSKHRLFSIRVPIAAKDTVVDTLSISGPPNTTILADTELRPQDVPEDTFSFDRANMVAFLTSVAGAAVSVELSASTAQPAQIQGRLLLVQSENVPWEHAPVSGATRQEVTLSIASTGGVIHRVGLAKVTKLTLLDEYLQA
jgi:hypothetical protein